MEFYKYVRKLKIYSFLFLVLTCSSMIIIGISGELLIHGDNGWIHFFVVFLLLLCADFVVCKKINEGGREGFEPFYIPLNVSYNYKELFEKLLSESGEENVFSISDHSSFFWLKKRPHSIRITLYGTDSFDKKLYDYEKKRINRIANKKYKFSQFVSLYNAKKYLRINLIVAENMNESLKNFISREASETLGRVEGIINLLILKDTLVIPPIAPTYYEYQVKRYSYATDFVIKLLTKNEDR